MVRQAHHERLNLSRLKLVAGKLVKPANFVAHEFTYELTDVTRQGLLPIVGWPSGRQMLSELPTLIEAA